MPSCSLCSDQISDCNAGPSMNCNWKFVACNIRNGTMRVTKVRLNLKLLCWGYTNIAVLLITHCIMQQISQIWFNPLYQIVLLCASTFETILSLDMVLPTLSVKETCLKLGQRNTAQSSLLYKSTIHIMPHMFSASYQNKLVNRKGNACLTSGMPLVCNAQWKARIANLSGARSTFLPWSRRSSSATYHRN